MSSQKELLEGLLGRGLLKSTELKEAWLKVDRAKFVPPEFINQAYEDTPLPLGKEQTISQPSVVAFMLDLLAVKKGMKILEVGSGSGFVTALLATLVGPQGKIISLEIISTLVEQAKQNLSFYNYANVNLLAADGSGGYKKEAPYDRIILSAAAQELKEELLEQLSDTGRLVAPVGRHEHSLLVWQRQKNKIIKKIYPGFIFVPLVSA
ncbi:protein-L-isoaspartate(D-aspartate) O-methyltransferase [Patescibacteria group bacterium]|nr:protein-L-isoaspartate(D-aspartate) O-methyltransferase [Patescibacteria group bacterium]